jgi:hypothetical protein
MLQNHSVRQRRLYRTSRLVHKLVHTCLNFLCGDSRQSLPLCFRSNMTIALGHSHRGTRRPSRDLRHGKRCTLLQQLCGCRVPQIMEAKPFKWILHPLYLRTTFYIATDSSRTLVLAARRALDRSCDATPRSAPVGDAARRINLSVFACGKNEMFRASRWKPICPVAQSCQSGWRKRNGVFRTHSLLLSSFSLDW